MPTMNTPQLLNYETNTTLKFSPNTIFVILGDFQSPNLMTV